MKGGVLKKKLLELIEQGASVTKACKLLQLHRSTVYDWKKSDLDFALKFANARVNALEETDDAADYWIQRWVREGDKGAVYRWSDHRHPIFMRDSIKMLVRGKEEHEDLATSMPKEQLFMIMRALKHTGLGGAVDFEPLPEKLLAEYAEWYKKNTPQFKPYDQI